MTTGGRMCTKRCPSEPRTCNVDVGAQYISNVGDYKDSHKEYVANISCTM